MNHRSKFLLNNVIDSIIQIQKATHGYYMDFHDNDLHLKKEENINQACKKYLKTEKYA